MPNVIVELWRELHRVQQLLPQLDANERMNAKEVLCFGRAAMALNRYEDMREAIDDLKDFGKPEPAEPEPEP